MKTHLAIVLMLLIGCMAWATGGGEASETVEIPDDIKWVVPDRIGNPNAKIVLSYGVEFAYSHQVDTPSRNAYLTTRMEEWAKANPNVRIEPQIYGGTGAEKLAKKLEQAASGTTPDFVQIDGQNVPFFYSKLKPLNDYYTQDEIDDWFDFAKEMMIDPSDQKLKALWFTTNCVGLWYRKDLIPDPPKDWDTFIAKGKEMQAQGFEAGFLAFGTGAQITYGSVIPLFFGLGGELIDADGEPIFGEGKNRQAMIDVMEFWDRAVKEGVVPKRIIDISSTGDLASEATKEGTLSMMLAGSWFLSRMADTLGPDLDKWDFTYTPQKEAGIRGQVPGGWTWGFFSKDKDHLDAAVDFADHVYVGTDGMAGWSEAAGYTPVRKSVLATPFFQTDRWQKAFGEVVLVGRARPGVPAYPIMAVQLQNAWQSVVLGRETPEEAVDKAFKGTLSQMR